MAKDLSPRLTEIVDALPLEPGVRVLEIGCGPGAAARAIAKRIGDGHILAIDRSAKAIQQARAASREELASGRMSLRQVAIEEFALESGEHPFDIAFAALIVRFQAHGMAKALFLMALAQTLVTGIAVAAGLGYPWSGPLELLLLNGFFVTLFIGSGWMFLRAARGQSKHHLA